MKRDERIILVGLLVIFGALVLAGFDFVGVYDLGWGPK